MKTGLLILASIVLFCNFAHAYDDGDFQVWNTDIEEFKIGKDLKLALEEEFRWGNNASEFFYQHYDAGMFYGLNKYLNLGVGYRHVYELRKGKFKLENEPYATASSTGISIIRTIPGGIAINSRLNSPGK